ncbi:hypothetical protein MMC25_000284 [Agyrium rufum]|nr:hypothetical protein [Agyrium rufum]
MFPFPAPPPSEFDLPSIPFQILSSPLTFFVQRIHSFLTNLRGPPYPLRTAAKTRSSSTQQTPSYAPIRLVCLSDTHAKIIPTSSIPEGDVLIHAGDLTNSGSAAEIQAQIDWLVSLPHPFKVVIAGNHDSYFDPRSRRPEDRDGGAKQLDWEGIHYLQHSSVTLNIPQRSVQKTSSSTSTSSTSTSTSPSSLLPPTQPPTRPLTLYGAPQIPTCGGPDFAFQYARGTDAWTDTIPLETDILITHAPPKYHFDLPQALGCEFLLAETWRVRPRVHIFGHVHAGYGREVVFWDGAQRAYERVRARGAKVVVGERERGKRGGWGWVGSWLQGVLDFREWWGLWVDVGRVVWGGVLGVLFARVWGAEGRGTVLVNGAATWRTTSELRNLPLVVEV